LCREDELTEVLVFRQQDTVAPARKVDDYAVFGPRMLFGYGEDVVTSMS
jgi:hypothetical protein